MYLHTVHTHVHIHVHVYVYPHPQPIVSCDLAVQDRINKPNMNTSASEGLTDSSMVVKIWDWLHIWLQFFIFKTNVHPPILHDTLEIECWREGEREREKKKKKTIKRKKKIKTKKEK